MNDDLFQKSARQLLSQSMRQRRQEIGISQEELANRCDLHRTYIGAIERGEQNVSLDNIEKISTALEISVAELFQEGGE